MPNTFFRFKQFVVQQDKCAMKVGTDGVLLGAWADVPSEGKVLDLGTGTGLVALMVAQRCGADVVAVDISGEACEQAAENVAESPWKDRIQVVHADAKLMGEDYAGMFDCIVSNPPYFKENVKCPGQLRNTARHTDELSFRQLSETSSLLLKEGGALSVVLPAGAAHEFIAEASAQRLLLSRQTWIHTKPGAQPKRVLMTFVKGQSVSTEVVYMTIHEADHSFSEAYKSLTSDFYLDR